MENNNHEQKPVEPEVMPGLAFDFDFITATLNLIPIQGESAAINLTSIVDIDTSEDGQWIIALENNDQFTLNDEEMAELEQTLRRRIEDNKARAKEAMIDNMRMQIEAQAEAQGRISGGKIVGVGKKSYH